MSSANKLQATMQYSLSWSQLENKKIASQNN